VDVRLGAVRGLRGVEGPGERSELGSTFAGLADRDGDVDAGERRAVVRFKLGVLW
jgi:hypothetical protein